MYKKEIIDYIRRNRVSTTEVADCLGKSGSLDDIFPINRGHFCVGEIKWVYGYDESNWSIHEQIADIEEGKVIFVQGFDCGKRALFGELVSKYLLLYKQSECIIVDGMMRDAGALIRQDYAIWCKGLTPVGCFNKKPQQEFDKETVKIGRERYDGSIAVCDDCGVVIIPKENINEEMFKRLQEIELQEDIWFERLDKYKESTFDIVCMKKYLNED